MLALVDQTNVVEAQNCFLSDRARSRSSGFFPPPQELNNELKDLFNNANNYRNLRNKLKTVLPPAMPYVGEPALGFFNLLRHRQQSSRHAPRAHPNSITTQGAS